MGLVPSASAAWQFTKQTGNFGGKLSYGKRRMAYGEVGTQPKPYLRRHHLHVVPVQRFDGCGASSSQNGFGGLFSDISGHQLKPERTREFEAGVDLGLFNDVADLSFTWYSGTRKTSSSGAGRRSAPGYVEGANGAEIRNAGTEWPSTSGRSPSSNFAWDLGFPSAPTATGW